MRRWIGALAVGALVTMAVTALAAIVLPAPAALALETGSLSGVVRDDQSQPLAAVTVTAWSPNGAVAGSAVSDGIGAYTISGLAPGTYVLSGEGAGRPGRFNGGSATLEGAAGISVPSGEDLTGVDLVLGPGGVLSGQVTDLDGDPVAGASVTGYSNGGFMSAPATTDLDGRFLLDGVPVGQVAVRVTHPEFTETWWPAADSRAGAQLLTVTDGSRTTDVDLEVRRGARIVGVITSAGAPVAGATITAWKDGGATPIEAISAVDGTYAVTGLAPGVYRLEAGAAGAVSEFFADALSAADASAVEISGPDTVGPLVFDLAPGSTIAGVVTGVGGLPEAGVTVTATGQGVSSGAFASAVTGADGRFRLDGLGAGSFQVAYSKPGFVTEYHDNALSADRAAGVTITEAGTAVQLTAQLALGGGVSGLITDRAGDPLAGVGVQAVGPEMTATAVTGADGRYTVSGLLPGQYRIGMAGDGVSPLWYPNSANEAGATKVTVTGGFVAPTNTVLMARTGAVSGTVRSSEGPVRDVLVRLTRPDGTSTATVRSGADGSYRFTSVAPGRYLVHFQVQGFAPVFHPSSPVPTGATELEVGTSEVTGIDVTLKVGGALTGVLVVPGGTGATGVTVSAWHLGLEAAPVASTVTSSAGAFRFAALVPGTYAVKADGTAVGLGVRWLDGALDLSSATTYTVADKGTTATARVEMPRLPTAVRQTTTTTTPPPATTTTTTVATAGLAAPVVVQAPATTTTLVPDAGPTDVPVPTVDQPTDEGATTVTDDTGEDDPVVSVVIPDDETANDESTDEDESTDADDESSDDESDGTSDDESTDDESADDESTDEGDAREVGPGGAFSALVPARILDTRIDKPAAPVCATAARPLQVAGNGGIPADGVGVVALNVTVTGASQLGTLTLGPSGAAAGDLVAMSYPAGATTSSVILARVAGNGRLSVASSAGCVHVVVDALGWFTVGEPGPGGLRASTSQRIVQSDPATPVCAASPLTVEIPGASAGDAVVLSMVATEPDRDAGVTVKAAGATSSDRADLTASAGAATSALAIERVGDGGAVTITVSGGCVPLAVDVLGVFTAGPAATGGLTTVDDDVLVDTASAVPANPVCSDETIDVQVAGAAGVPAEGVASVLVSVTATAPTAPGFVTVFPSGASRPGTSTLSLVPGRTSTNLALVPVGEDGSISLYNAAGCTHVSVVVKGWFASPRPTTDV